MTPLLALAQNNAYELTPASHKLPPLVWSAFTTLNQIHGVWRWYRRIELYRHPDTFAQMLAGHVLNLAIGDILFVRIAAQCLLIATRVLECAQQQSKLYHAGERWLTAFQGHYPLPCKKGWNTRHTNIWISPSSTNWLTSKNETFCEYIKKIIKCTLSIFKHFFKLSMKLMDAMDAFYLTPHTYNEGMNEFFVNGMKWLDCIVKNKEELLMSLESNKKIIENILSNSSITYIQLHESVASTLEKTETVYQFSNGIFGHLGQRMLTGGRIVLGF